jgi:hypothetical protein
MRRRAYDEGRELPAAFSTSKFQLFNESREAAL